MTLLLIYLFLALGVSFLCSVLEAVLLSTTPSYLNVKLENGNKKAKLFMDLKKNVDRPLSAILTLNTVAHTVGAAGVGAQATKVFGEAYFGVISFVLTILILVFSEIIPKTIGARYWRSIALVSAQLIQYLIYITYPLVIISEYITKMISSKAHESTTTSREELSVLANVGTEEGIFEEGENKIIQSIIKRKAVTVHEVMTHRTELIALSTNASLEEVVAVVNKEKYSRVPIYEDNIDNIVGILHAKDLIEYLSGSYNKDEFYVRNFSRPPYMAPMFKTLDQLFRDFQQNKIHMAIIIDEFGGTAGIVTLEDLLEEIVGEIFDEDDEIVKDIIKADENTFYVNGSISLDDVADYFKVDLPIEKYETLNGFIVGQIGRIPEAGDEDSIEYAGLVFKVEEVDGRMISKVKVCKALDCLDD